MSCLWGLLPVSDRILDFLNLGDGLKSDASPPPAGSVLTVPSALAPCSELLMTSRFFAGLVGGAPLTVSIPSLSFL